MQEVNGLLILPRPLHTQKHPGVCLLLCFVCLFEPNTILGSAAKVTITCPDVNSRTRQLQLISRYQPA